MLPCLYPLQRAKNLPPCQKRGVRFDTKLHLMVWLHFWGVWSIPSFPLLQVRVDLEVLVPVRVPCMGLMDLFKNYFYLIENFKKELHKKRRYEHTMKMIPYSLSIE